MELITATNKNLNNQQRVSREWWKHIRRNYHKILSKRRRQLLKKIVE